jgi:hypothetical protein
MATVSKWAPKRVTAGLATGEPSSAYTMYDPPLYDSSTGKFYCVWVSTADTKIRELGSTTDLATVTNTSITCTFFHEGAFLSGGYLYLGKATKVSTTHHFFVVKLSTTTWAETSVKEVDTGVFLSASTVHLSMDFDGTSVVYITERWFTTSTGQGGFYIRSLNIGTAALATLYDGSSGNTALRLVTAPFVNGANVYFEAYNASSALYSVLQLAIAGGSPSTVRSSADFMALGYKGFHSEGATLYDCDEANSWDLAAIDDSRTSVLALNDDGASPKIILRGGQSQYLSFFEGTTLIGLSPFQFPIVNSRWFGPTAAYGTSFIKIIRFEADSVIDSKILQKRSSTSTSGCHISGSGAEAI